MNDAVFVLGAGGFIGRSLVMRLASKGHDVIAATRRPVSFGCAHIQNVVGTWDESAQFARWMSHCGAIVHAASASTPGSSAAQPQLDGNLRVTLALIEALQELPNRRLLFLSSAGTLYGDRNEPAREDDPLRPRSYHGAGKAAAEHFLGAWAAQYGGTAVLLRPSNVYGPEQLPRRGFGIIPTALDCALNELPLSIWGDGSTERDYLYIDDLLALCEITLQETLDAGTYAFNAAFGKGVALNALLDRIEAITAHTIERRYGPARRVDVCSIAVDAAAARAAFAWLPVIPLDEGLRRTWQWFSSRN